MSPGLAGFAFGIVAAAAWLHILTPIETATLIIGYGLIVQSIAVRKLRRALSWQRLWPFLAGGAVGAPVGASLLTWANPAAIRTGIGFILVLYAIYGLARPHLKVVRPADPTTDIGVGVAKDLWNAIATHDAPQIIDVRRREAYVQSLQLLPAALWRDAAAASQWSNEFDHAQPIVVACKAGHEMSQWTVAQLRADNYDARVLEGGYEGWAKAGLPFVAKPELDRIAPKRPTGG